MQIFGLDIHGVRLNLQSAHAPLIEYAKEHLCHRTFPAFSHPHVTVQCQWSQAKWDETKASFPFDDKFNAIGNRMLGKTDELLWLNTLRRKGLQLRFLRESYGFFFEVSYVYHPNEQKVQSVQRYEYRKYFSLMPYLVYFPIMWHLERERGWTMVHASALATGRGSVIIAGLGATGKTTTCIALLQQPGFELISENLIFTDGEFIYPCYEPIRLNEDSLKLLGGRAPQLSPMAFPEGLKEKSFFHFSLSEKAYRTKPIAVFLPQFSSQSYVRELSPKLAAERIIAMNRLSLELDDYGWYASALDMQWPTPGLATERVETIRRFAAKPGWYELGIDRSAGVSRTVQDILRNI